MLNRYLVLLYTPDASRGMLGHKIGRYKTLASATTRARALLGRNHTQYTTRALGRSSRSPWIDVYRVSKGGYMRLETSIDAPLEYVPSVGELGWTP